MRHPALALVLLAGCAGAPPTALSTGSEHLDRERSAVVFLSSDCTGVLVAPRAVLTAAHCVAGADALPTVHVRRGPELWNTRSVACRMHPGALGLEPCDQASTARTREAHDLAVLRLAAPVPGSLARPIPVLLAPPVERPREWWRGRRVRLVGWHRRPALVGAALRYSGDNAIVSVRGPVMIAVAQARGGFSTRVGASGGPALLSLEGREHVIGILYGGQRADSADSVYSATFHPDNASWLVRAVPEAFGAELRPVVTRATRRSP